MFYFSRVTPYYAGSSKENLSNMFQNNAYKRDPKDVEEGQNDGHRKPGKEPKNDC